MARQVTKDQMRGRKAHHSDTRIVHALLTSAADADLQYIKSAYHALTLTPVNQSAVIRRALNLLAERLVKLYGAVDTAAEVKALLNARKADLTLIGRPPKPVTT